MKRACLWMVAIGLFITVGFLTVGPAYAGDNITGRAAP